MNDTPHPAQAPALPVPEKDNSFWYVYNEADTVVVFIHGILSNSISAWRYEDKAHVVYWPDLIRADVRLSAPAIYMAGYYTSVTAGDFTINNAAREVLDALQCEDTQGRRPPLEKPKLLFVCHSTGGIVARYMLERYKDTFKEKAIGLVLIASPSLGSVYANKLRLLAKFYNQQLGLQLQWGGESLRDLDNRFKDLVHQKRLPLLTGIEAYENHFVLRKQLLPGWLERLLPNRNKVVEELSAGRYFGAPRLLPGTDHFTAVKPDRLTHPAHQLLVTFWAEFQQFVAESRPAPAHSSDEAEVAPLETALAGPSVDAAEARRGYLTSLRRVCLKLPLGALGGEGRADEEDVTLDQVYIGLNTTTHIEGEDADKSRERLRDSFEKEKLLPALDAVARHESLVLLGDPGGGKSTFVKHLLAGYAKALLDGTAPPAGLDPDRLPLLVTLRDLVPRLDGLALDALTDEDRCQVLTEIVQDQGVADLEGLKSRTLFPGPLQRGFAGPLRKALGEGGCFLVLDGLDEVPPRLRYAALQVVTAMLEREHRVVVTCRIRSYAARDDEQEMDRPKHRLPLHDYTLAPFDPAQIRAFAHAWYHAQHERGREEAERAREGGDGLAHAATSKDLLELAGNPMLLTTMALIHQKHHELPHERVRLYKQAVDILVREWRRHKTGKAHLTRSKALNAFLYDNERLWPTLERLAYQAHHVRKDDPDGKEAVDLPLGEALVLLREPEYLGDVALAEQFLAYVDEQTGLLVGRGAAPNEQLTYSFAHRTFQEYLAGCYLIGLRDRQRRIWQHAGDGDAWSLAVTLGAEEMHYVRRMRHELLDLAYALCPTDAPEGKQAQRAVLWSGTMARLVGPNAVERDTNSPTGGPAYLTRLRASLAATLSGVLPPPERAEAGRLLAHLGDPRPAVTTLEALPLCLVPAGPFRMGSNKQDDELAYGDEAPQHPVDVSYACWMARYPVTNAQYAAYVEGGGYAERAYWTEAGWQWREREGWTGPRAFDEPYGLPNHPVVGISWYEALAFTRWLTARLYEAGTLPAEWTVTLPSEVEWEKAARGGVEVVAAPVIRDLGKPLAVDSAPPLVPNTHLARRWPWWADAITPDRANYSGAGIGTTSAVGAFPGGVSPYGVEELSGNVWEWTRSLWESYPYPDTPEARVGREALDSKKPRVLRGGSFFSSDYSVRCSARVNYNPDYRYDSVGCRVVFRPLLLDGRSIEK